MTKVNIFTSQTTNYRLSTYLVFPKSIKMSCIGMVNESQFTYENLHHMNKYKHYKNEYKEKEECADKDECKIFIRCEQGQDENNINDKCHMKIYRHPPRTRQIKLAENMHSLIINKSSSDNSCILPGDEDAKNME